MTTGGLEGLGVLHVSGPRLPALTGSVKAKIRHTSRTRKASPQDGEEQTSSPLSKSSANREWHAGQAATSRNAGERSSVSGASGRSGMPVILVASHVVAGVRDHRQVTTTAQDMDRGRVWLGDNLVFQHSHLANSRSKGHEVVHRRCRRRIIDVREPDDFPPHRG